MQQLRSPPTFQELAPLILTYLVAPYSLAALVIWGRGKTEFILLLIGLVVAGYGTYRFVSAVKKRLPVRLMPDGTVTNGFKSAQLADCKCVLIRHEEHCWHYTALVFRDCEFAVANHKYLHEDVRRASELAVRLHVPAFVEHADGKRQRIRVRPRVSI